MKGLKKIDKTQRFLIAIIVVYCIIVAMRNPAFLSLTTLFNMVRSAAGTTILAMGVLVVMISGGIDVSFPAVAIFGGYASLRICMWCNIKSLFLAFLISIAIGILLGLINAVLINILKLEPFIITLATASVFFGVMTILIGTKNVGASDLPEQFRALSSAKIFTTVNQYGGKIGLSVFIIPVVLCVLLTYIILHKTLIGKGIFALGCNNEAARRAGFNVTLLRLFIYGYAGFLGGIMGIIYIAGTNSVNPVSLVGTEMSVIACVVIGGAKPSGGYGKIFGTLLGVILYFLFNQTLVYLGLSAAWQDFFMGIVLLISIMSTSYQNRVQNRKNFIYTE
ncbi:ABC transporter permease [Jingyaoa shaoxingensis]|uniref:ABC transporter permease n=1 Tax=Jingyaoa shaoxingensis TaxID=2763671 RepID=A0ABR7NBL5_9FIRM|nr:ABC transporter permease [Jingyaoa shaoxingensis]MBC8573207.1 ABC transporter permease [Jingyaoa shaoxingensis]